MSGPEEGFLSRWSRRKRANEEAASDVADGEPRKAIDARSVRPRESGAPESQPKAQATLGSRLRGNERDKAQEQEKPAEPKFDISKLPPIDSITAETDIRAFLAPGVPLALTQAALRRTWVADPKIRDFIEIAENQWDFNAPGISGFDLSPPTGDLKRMVAEILRDESPDESQSARPQIAGEGPEVEKPVLSTNVDPGAHEVATHAIPVGEQPEKTVDSETDSPEETARQPLVAEHKNWNSAPQQNDAMQNSGRPVPRRVHGRAMPR